MEHIRLLLLGTKSRGTDGPSLGFLLPLTLDKPIGPVRLEISFPSFGRGHFWCRSPRSFVFVGDTVVENADWQLEMQHTVRRMAANFSQMRPHSITKGKADCVDVVRGRGEALLETLPQHDRKHKK